MEFSFHSLLLPSCDCRTGFSLLFYGLGSKRNLLEAFAKTFILVTGGKCIEVLGYLPHINLKEVHRNLEPARGDHREKHSELFPTLEKSTTDFTQTTYNSTPHQS